MSVPSSSTDPHYVAITEGRGPSYKNAQGEEVLYAWCGDFVTYCLWACGLADPDVLNRNAVGRFEWGWNIARVQAGGAKYGCVLVGDAALKYLRSITRPEDGGDILVVERAGGGHIGFIGYATSNYDYVTYDGNGMYGRSRVTPRKLKIGGGTEVIHSIILTDGLFERGVVGPPPVVPSDMAPNFILDTDNPAPVPSVPIPPIPTPGGELPVPGQPVPAPYTDPFGALGAVIGAIPSVFGPGGDTSLPDFGGPSQDVLTAAWTSIETIAQASGGDPTAILTAWLGGGAIPGNLPGMPPLPSLPWGTFDRIMAGDYGQEIATEIANAWRPGPLDILYRSDGYYFDDRLPRR